MCRALQQLGSVGLSVEVLVCRLQPSSVVKADSPALFAQEQHLGRFVLHTYGVKAAARTSSAEAVRPTHESRPVWHRCRLADSSLAQARFLGLTELAMPAAGPTASHRSLAAALFPVVASAFVAPDGLAPADVSADDIAVLLAKEARGP